MGFGVWEANVHMLSWFLRLIGVGDTLAQRVAEAQWLWARPAVFWVGVVLLVPVAVFVWRRHKRALPYVSAPMRSVLTCCRVGVLAVLIFVLGGPYLRLVEEVTHKPIVAVLLDDSASMGLPAGLSGEAMRGAGRAMGMVDTGENGSNGPASALSAAQRKTLSNLSRAQLVGRVLAHQWDGTFAPLAERFDLRTYRFGRSAQRAKLVGDERETGDGDGVDRADTAIGAALRSATRDAGGRGLAGLVLISDGRNTTGPAVLDVARDMTDAPVWSVPVGSAAPMADVSLVDAAAGGARGHGLGRGDRARPRVRRPKGEGHAARRRHDPGHAGTGPARKRAAAGAARPGGGRDGDAPAVRACGDVERRARR